MWGKVWENVLGCGGRCVRVEDSGGKCEER